MAEMEMVTTGTTMAGTFGAGNPEVRQQWLDALADGSLIEAMTEDERLRFAAEVGNDPRLEADRQCWEALHRILREDRIPVRDGFAEKVLTALPEPAWQPSSTRFYPGLVAALLICTIGATYLLAGLADQPLAGTGLALADFLQTTLLAGSGLLAATWVGLGFGLEKVFATSGASLAAFAILVTCLNLLFVSLLRRRAPVVGSARSGQGQ